MIRDAFHRTARKLRISLTDRCQMRCFYCMPATPAQGFMPRSDWLSFDEIVTVASVAADCGVQSVRLTGGEPLTRTGVPELVQRLKQRTTLTRIAMTTNGLQLPEFASELFAAGLDDLTVSLDTLRPERMRVMGGGDYLPAILGGIDAARAAGFTTLKINSVIVRGVNDDEISDLARFAWSVGAEPRFIEYMPLDATWERDKIVTAQEIADGIAAHFGPLSVIRTEASSTAMRYYVAGSARSMGIIPTYSHAFCGDCDRIRLTADGRVLGCLYSTSGPSVRDVLRANASDTDGVARALRLSYTNRGIGYMQQLQNSAQRIEHSTAMYAVGG